MTTTTANLLQMNRMRKVTYLYGFEREWNEKRQFVWNYHLITHVIFFSGVMMLCFQKLLSGHLVNLLTQLSCFFSLFYLFLSHYISVSEKQMWENCISVRIYLVTGSLSFGTTKQQTETTIHSTNRDNDEKQNGT